MRTCWILLLAACGGDSTTKTTDDTLPDPQTSDTSAPLDTADTAGTSPTADTGTTPAQDGLVVEGGFGWGGEAPGAPIHVWADVNPQEEILTGWSGDVALIEAPEEWNAAGEMVGTSARLVATVEPVSAPVIERAYALDSGTRRVLIASPKGPSVGLVLHFHGGIYAVDNLWDNAARTTVMHLVRAGYTVAALESGIEVLLGSGGWDWDTDPGSNADLRNAIALIDALRSDGTVPPGTPAYAWGMSSGGMFAHSMGAGGHVDAVVAFCAAGTQAAMSVTSTPTAWYLAERDNTFPTAVAEATTYQAEMTSRGIDTELLVHPPTPLYDERFTRVRGIDLATSATIAASLRTSGATDADGLWLMSGEAVTRDLDQIDGIDGLNPAQQEAVAAEIEIMAAEHELYDDVSARLVAFLDAVRGP